MPNHIEKYGKILCPQCGWILDINSITYNKIENGVFKSKDVMIYQTEERCPNCHWSDIIREER
jgi:hypothetical protein